MDSERDAFVAAYAKVCENRPADHNEIGVPYFKAGWNAGKALCVTDQQHAAAQQGAVPVATIHSDGYWTHEPGKDPFDRFGPYKTRSKLDVYLAPNPPAPEREVAISPATVLPDGSAFATASFPLPKDHWLYSERVYLPSRDEPVELSAPILTHTDRDAVVAAVRYAVRGATMCGQESDFDPDALVQNAVYALCGPFTKLAAQDRPPRADQLDHEYRKGFIAGQIDMRDRPEEQPAEPLAVFEEPLVQAVYEILCDATIVPPECEHWEGYLARLIVDRARLAHRAVPTDAEIDAIAARIPIGPQARAVEFAREILRRFGGGEDARDAARYRWLRRYSKTLSEEIWTWDDDGPDWTGPEGLDAAIDAARGESGR